jgi:lipoate-protein ligase A
MLRLELIAQPSVEPCWATATDRHLLACAARAGRSGIGSLHVYAVPGCVVAMGRYHLAPQRWNTASGVALWRRGCGGRVLPFGKGFVGVALILPHRAALVAEDPNALQPAQVLNRCVRGLLRALRRVRVDAVYPGRDLITVERAALAAVSFESLQTGATLVEMTVANSERFSVLPNLLTIADEESSLLARAWREEETTCVARRLGGELSFTDVVELLRLSYAEEFGIEVLQRELGQAECVAIQRHLSEDCSPAVWVSGRRRDLDLDRHGFVWGQLGAIEALFKVSDDGRIARLRLAGDFIANSSTIARLEDRLRDSPLERDAINAIVRGCLGSVDDFLLGAGDPPPIAELLLGGG